MCSDAGWILMITNTNFPFKKKLNNLYKGHLLIPNIIDKYNKIHKIE